LQIKIISTSVETKPTAKGSYQILEVIYKNLTYQGKVENKKIPSFGNGATAFKALSDTSPGSEYDVTVVKNAQGYNDWTSVQPSTGVAESPASKTSVTNNSPRSTYETPEERAQRQVFIIRQSSLNNAISTLSVGSKAVKPDDVIRLASQYTNWVMGIKDPGATGFDDLPDFPLDEPQVD
jgi:hypothetical protein